jgi:hypothetical protein
MNKKTITTLEKVGVLLGAALLLLLEFAMLTSAMQISPTQCHINQECYLGDYVINSSSTNKTVFINQICNISIAFPNNSVMISQAWMTNNSDGFHNYSFVPTVTGFYHALISCANNSEVGRESALFYVSSVSLEETTAYLNATNVSLSNLIVSINGSTVGGNTTNVVIIPLASQLGVVVANPLSKGMDLALLTVLIIISLGMALFAYLEKDVLLYIISATLNFISGTYVFQGIYIVTPTSVLNFTTYSSFYIQTFGFALIVLSFYLILLAFQGIMKFITERRGYQPREPTLND